MTFVSKKPQGCRRTGPRSGTPAAIQRQLCSLLLVLAPGTATRPQGGYFVVMIDIDPSSARSAALLRNLKGVLDVTLNVMTIDMLTHQSQHFFAPLERIKPRVRW